jgi:subtilisin family serine protease
VITVAAITNQDLMPTWSNWGVGSVQLAAPGDSIYTASSSQALGGGSWYTYHSGTSFAAPVVTGIIALEAAENPAATMWQRRQAVINTVTHTTALSTKVLTGGRANAFLAVWQVGQNFLPQGNLDVVTTTGAQGWAYDADIGQAPVHYQIWSSNQPGATLLGQGVTGVSRPDLISYIGGNAVINQDGTVSGVNNQGFLVTFSQSVVPGSTVYLYVADNNNLSLYREVAHLTVSDDGSGMMMGFAAPVPLAPGSTEEGNASAVDSASIAPVNASTEPTSAAGTPGAASFDSDYTLGDPQSAEATPMLID